MIRVRELKIGQLYLDEHGVISIYLGRSENRSRNKNYYYYFYSICKYEPRYIADINLYNQTIFMYIQELLKEPIKQEYMIRVQVFSLKEEIKGGYFEQVKSWYLTNQLMNQELPKVTEIMTGHDLVLKNELEQGAFYEDSDNELWYYIGHYGYSSLSDKEVHYWLRVKDYKSVLTSDEIYFGDVERISGGIKRVYTLTDSKLEKRLEKSALRQRKISIGLFDTAYTKWITSCNGTVYKARF